MIARIILFFIFIIFCHVSAHSKSKPCNLRSYPSGNVCVCNSTYCDTIEETDVHLLHEDHIIIVTSSKRGLRFSINHGSWADPDPIIIPDDTRKHSSTELRSMSFLEMFLNLFQSSKNSTTLTVRPSIRHQRMWGFGGAMTFSAALNLDNLPEALEDHVISSYYSKESGIGYSMLRMAIGGSDFDTAPWTYNEWPLDDTELSTFKELHPKDIIITRKIKKAAQIYSDTNDGKTLKIKAAAWVCPRWMRTRESFHGFGLLKPEYYQTWADYHVRFLQLMREQGIDIWAISTGNEPMNGLTGWLVVNWMTLGWSPENVAKYIAENLGPTLRNSPFNQTLLLAGDDQRLSLPWYFVYMRNAHPHAFDYIDGIAVHMYLDKYMSRDALKLSKLEFPDLEIINTESSIGDMRYTPRGPDLGSWDRAVEYIDYYLDSMHSVVGWIDWNLALDETGGPNYVGNVVDAPVIANATAAEVYKQPIFYVIGHFSKFVHEGSVRIEGHAEWDQVQTLAFLRPDNVIVVLVHNKNKSVVKVTLRDEERGEREMLFPAESFSTVLYQPK